ncbi:hypothetical protein AB0425_29440 [Actinosynnema sp. NPDC051121]|nr:hypothetical protein [Saccharothrix sp.]
MSEADLREGLRAAVGDEPPLDFDADELIRRAQHARRRRRALVAVAVMTLALTGTVLSLPYVVDQRSRIDAAGTVLTTTVSPTGSPIPSSASAPPRPTITTERPPVPTTVAPGAATQLPVYLSKRFAEVVPDAKVVSADASETTDAGPGSLSAWLGFVDGVGSSKVAVRLVAPPYGTTWDQYCAKIKCAEAVRQEDGTFVTSSWGTTAVPEPNGLMCTVAHFRADGSVVEVTGYGYAPTADGETAPGQVALTYDQLVALATDPELTTP